MIFLSATETERLADWPSSIRAMAEAYARPAEAGAVPGRLIASSASAWIRCLPAIPPGRRYMGAKQISRTRDGRLTYLITLYDQKTGALAWIIDAVAITAMRTAATSAAALDLLSGEGEMRLAVLGSGQEAREHVAAVAAVRRPASLSVYSPTAANRERFARDFEASLGIPVVAASSAEAAVAGATHVVAAARSRSEEPILFAEWLRPGAVVVSVGSTSRSQRELDAGVVARAAVIVADVPEELARDTGDMLAAAAAGVGFRDRLFSLHDLVQDRIPSHFLGEDGIRLFKSVGSALQDVAFAELVASRAEAAGLGTALPVDLSLKQSIGANT